MRDLIQMNAEISRLKETVKELLHSRKSHSDRIKAMKRKMENVISSHKYYIRHRLPAVLSGYRKRMELFNRYGDWRKRLKTLFEDVGRTKLIKLSNEGRTLVYFTTNEYHRLKKLLHQKPFIMMEMRHLQRGRHLIFVTRREGAKLRRILRTNWRWQK